MNQERKQQEHDANTQPNQRDSALERLVKHIEPPGREVTDDDVKDPGRMTPGQKHVDNRS